MGTLYIAVSHKNKKIYELGKWCEIAVYLKDKIVKPAPNNRLLHYLVDTSVRWSFSKGEDLLETTINRIVNDLTVMQSDTSYSEYDWQYEEHATLSTNIHNPGIGDYALVGSVYFHDDVEIKAKPTQTWQQYWEELLRDQPHF